MQKKVLLITSAVLLLAFLVSPFSLTASRASSSTDAGEPVVRSATRTDSIQSLREIKPRDFWWMNFVELPRKILPNRPAEPGVPVTDPVLQPDSPTLNAGTTLLSFEGVNNVNGVLPPDTVGDIGPNHYVQAVNLAFAIYDRSGNRLYGPANINTLFSGFGGACESANDGDPIVLYDHLADRWLISQFALPRFPRGPFYQCIAISQTPDPTGGWYRYEFLVSSKKMNDYPHFGVWSDGYYMTMNQFNQLSLSWGGQGAVVFERDKMLQGQTARMVYFDLYATDPNLGGMLPSDLDGPVPPAGTPNYFIQADDNAWGYSPDQLQIWKFSVNWANTSSSTFTKVGALPVAAFDTEMCGGSRNCIPQPGGINVDAISDRLMYRVAYRNFGDHQTMVLNHTVDVDGTDHAGVRWYELRDSGSGWGVYQQGTFAPDANHRWMASVAMNGNGEIALGYSISSTSKYPSIYYTGRSAGDPLGQMTAGEGVIINGSGYQNHSSGRWGDYSMMAVDPTDDCTFWYTQEYYTTTTGASWQTRVGHIQLSTCGTPVDNPPSVSVTSPAEGTTVSGSVPVTATASDDHGVTQVQFFVDNVSIGIDTNGGDGWSVNWNSTSVSDGGHVVKAVATDTIGQTGQDTNNVTVNNTVVDNPPTATVTSPAEGATVSGTIPVTATASDDHGVTQVQFFVDNISIGTDTNGGDGWSVNWNTTSVSNGGHVVKAVATDTIGQTGQDTNNVTVNNTVVEMYLHVGDLDGSSSGSRRWTATVTITVHDANHNPVDGATVSGDWGGGASGSGSCTTDTSGTCSISTNVGPRYSSATFTVSNITKSGWTYQSAANHDPDGDSNGTAITINR